MTRPDSAILCPACGYDLRGTPGDRCPECGTAFDRTLGSPITPWLRRGNWRVVAFWQTAWLATWRPSRIAQDVVQPADLHAAKRFRRWLVAWLAPWPVLVAAALYVDTVIPSTRFGTIATTNPLLNIRYSSLIRRWSERTIPDGRWQNHWTWWLESGSVGVALAMLIVWIAFALGVPSYFCHPRRLPRDAQDRAIPLSYLAAAPLAWLPLTWLIAIAIEWAWLPNTAAWTWNGTPSPLAPAAQLVARVAQALPTLIVIATSLRAVATIVGRATHAGLGRPIAAALVTAIAWPALFVLFPAATFVALVALQYIAFTAGWLPAV